MKDYSAETGAALADEDQPTKAFAHAVVTPATRTPSPGTFATIALDRITPSLTNPRKTFDPAKLQDLAESIRSSGVHQPVVVRSLPGSRLADTDRTVQYELVVGERRLRASIIAGVDTIPAIVRPLSDDQVLEIQIVENLQRDDLTELEEAEGYEALMQHSHLSAEQVGDKIGKSRSYVYGRLKLLDLCQEARASLRDRTIDASRALLVARIPDHKLQIKAMKEIARDDTYYGSSGDPMGYRKAAEHVQRNYMLKLSDARFTITAADLVPEAGSCKTCPKRTGHDPDLFSDVKGADVCTDPPCFHKKEEAHAASLVQAAQAKGQTVISGKEAHELAAQPHYAATKFKGYRRLDAAEDSPTNVPLRKIIGAQMKAEGIKPVLIAHPTKTGEMVECLPNEVALRLLKAVEGQAAAAKTVSKEVKALVDEKKAKTEAKAKDRFEAEWRSTLVHDTWCALRDDAEIQAFNVDVHRYLLLRAANSLSTDHAAALAKLLGLGKVAPTAAIIDLAKETPDPARLHLLIVMQESSSAYESTYNRVANEGMLLVAGNVFGDKLTKVIDEIKAEVKARIWPEPAKKPAQSDPPHSPAAPAGGAAASPGGKGAKAKKADSPLRKPKTSASEAQAQIAAAMQAEDQKTEPGADAQGIEATASGFALAVGARVTILPSATGPKVSKWIGKTGTVRGPIGPEAWDVCFTAKVAKPVTGKAVAEFQSFHVTELEVVE
jgi:ParB/RepB/Spo0J family partition protein